MVEQAHYYNGPRHRSLLRHRWWIFFCFFLSGAASLILEVLWSRQFVTVFGNSSYAISIVLCAYMAGLGLGGMAGGALADRAGQRLRWFGATQLGIGLWALAVPGLLAQLRGLAQALPALSAESLLLSTVTRFGLAFAILVVPCFLMGMTLPLLARAVTESDHALGARLGVLYCWNTLGSALGCLAAGFWLVSSLGLWKTNLVAVAASLAAGLLAMAAPKPADLATVPEAAGPPAAKRARKSRASQSAPADPIPAALLLAVAFFNGLANLACEMLWMRYLAFLHTQAYLFSTLLCVYLSGLGLGSLAHGLVAGRIRFPARVLGVVELLLGASVLLTFAIGGLVFASGPPRPLELTGMALVTVLLPALLMGFGFPLSCSLYGSQTEAIGRRIGGFFALNVAGTIFGSILPIFLLVPFLGIQRSLLVVSMLYAGLGLLLLGRGGRAHARPALWAGGAYAVVLLGFAGLVPSDLCQGVLRASDFNLGRQVNIEFYREGRTGTATVVSNRVNGARGLYINGVSEVPLSYANNLCFKMLGDLGPMLHPHPEEVLMICFGGGIAAGSTSLLPEVKSLTIVDLESSVLESARFLADENNHVLQNPKAHVVIDDGRNFILTSKRCWPVVVSDSTHPKAGDSWVLYTQEFYRLVREHLSPEGVFVQWLPMHELSTAEFKLILRTFQSIFPHTSLWVTSGMDSEGRFATYSLLAATPKALEIDVTRLGDRLKARPVHDDLQPYGLETPAGFLDSFICAEASLRQWVGAGPVNTDDLPYTQYKTAFARGPAMGDTYLVEPMEDLGAYLTAAGPDAAGRLQSLRQELALRAKCQNLALQHRLREAYEMFPDDVRFRQMRRLYDQGANYILGLQNLYWDNAQMLLFLSFAAMSHPGGANVAVPLLERIVQLDPNNAQAFNILGGIYLDSGYVNEAEGFLTRSVALAPGIGVAHFNLALAWERMGRHAAALQEWKTAASLADGKDPSLPDQWGSCLASQGRLEEAASWFQRALDLDPAYIPSRLHLAALLHATGRQSEALPHLRYVRKLEPDNKTAAQLMGESPSKLSRSN